ncbi:hypothetical protein PVAND_013781 [Polypedilum vanderplanki]|uniref:Uncharacterized protein n=1 Tax=Polypedilum vanderplanki TaxID=319348 RepID=A0A9J6CRN8_POLVA|nr:hypothetical protein PVAND_013781 [Polypedilum vanderplanki]
MQDLFGTLADYNKAFISFATSFIIIIEPLLNYDRYIEFQKISNALLEDLNKDFVNIFNSNEIRKKIKTRLRKIIFNFLIIYTIFESKKFIHSMYNVQTKNINFLFVVTAVIVYSKTWHIIYQMLIIEEYLLIIIKPLKQINQEIYDNLQLNLKIYNEIIHQKYTKIIKMYQQIQHLVSLFNAIGVPQLTIFIVTKLFLISEFYWIALVTMHEQIRIGVTYS